MSSVSVSGTHDTQICGEGSARGRLRWIAGVIVLLAACGGDDGGSLPLVDDIEPAIVALEEQLGGVQDYFEVIASPLAVTLWVADDDATSAVRYLYADGEIAGPDEPRDASGETFTADEALTFDPDRVLDQVHNDLEGSMLTQFSIVGGPGDAVAFTVVAESERGGRLDVRVGPSGEVLEAVVVDEEVVEGSNAP